MSLTSPVRRVERVRHELVRRDVEVARVESVSPQFLAVTFAGAALEGFTSLSFDDHLKFMFVGPSGEVHRRDYTPRHFDAARRELTIEFALHAGGLASDWARQAQPGMPATIGGPRGSMIIPTDFDWHLLVGDATALPAIHRRLEELPPGSRVQVIAHAPTPDDQRAMPTRADAQVRWVPAADGLVSAVRELALPAGEGFVWCAGEAAVMARMRDVLATDKRHPREAMRVAAYWKVGAEGHHENLE